ncbi:unnamed protein product [Chrysoparadoxa australica]
MAHWSDQSLSTVIWSELHVQPGYSDPIQVKVAHQLEGEDNIWGVQAKYKSGPRAKKQLLLFLKLGERVRLVLGVNAAVQLHPARLGLVADAAREWIKGRCPDQEVEVVAALCDGTNIGYCAVYTGLQDASELPLAQFAKG